MKFQLSPIAVAIAAVFAPCAFADAETPTVLPEIQVTATREAEPVDKVPAAISVVSGDELRALGANDLRTALSLVAGVEGTPGGDGGPAGAVPSLWGLREQDAFLLVVDGVPWGGAFNPATPSIDLNGVERIEILRGSAPVMFGATSFVGVIHVIHYAAGTAPPTASLTGGSYGTVGASGTVTLSSTGFRQSLSATAEKRGYQEDRTGFKRYDVLYRGGADLGAARFHVDGNISVIPQEPAGNLLLRDGGDVHYELPIDANYNPSGAHVDQKRYHLAAGFDGTVSFGDWGTTLAVTRTSDDILRGFLRGNAFANPPDDGVGDGLQADGYSQSRGITDVYLDGHVVSKLGDALRLTWGADYLYGSGEQDAINFGYCEDVNGNELACAGAHHDDEIVHSEDTRNFVGAYVQADWQATRSLDVLAGLRLNHTRESASGLEIDNTGAVPVPTDHPEVSDSHTRLSGMVGASWLAWSADRDALSFYADYRNSFKPLALDFGPEAEAELLQPETAHSYEVGAKTRLLGGKLDIDASVFRMDFRNGLTFADDGTGAFVRANGGEQRFQGFEVESRFELAPSLALAAHYASHDARLRRFTRDNGAPADGNRVEMSPYQLAGAGLMYLPRVGFQGAVIAEYVGRRKLNKSNSRETGGYGTVDATLGYNFGKFGVHVNGYNLGDRREPVAESELQEAVTVTGTAGYYRLPARLVTVSVSVDLD